MGQITYTDPNGVEYSNLTAPGKSLHATISRDGYLSESGQPVTHEYIGKIQEPTKFINAIDIDWGEILLADYINEIDVDKDLPTDTITSTADLISVIAMQKKQINSLSNIIKKIINATSN